MKNPQKRIADFVRKEYIRFIRNNKDYLKKALEQDYEELPDIPKYDSFFESLRNNAINLASETSIPQNFIDSLVSRYDASFYRQTLPSLDYL